MNSDLRRRAIALLARREHSRAELARKLAATAVSSELDPLLDELEREGYLSDRRFADVYVAARTGRIGRLRLRRDLLSRGVSGAVAEAALDGVGDDAAALRALWERRFGALPGDQRDYARQARFLISRGFSGESVHRLLSGREQ